MTRRSWSEMSVGFCTLAIHAAYRVRARLLCADVPTMPWVVLTDEPGDFADLPVRAIRHVPTGPMACDYLRTLGPTGNGRGAAAYHDKRFALEAVLQGHDTALYLDADSRLETLPDQLTCPAGLAVAPLVRHSIATHLETCGTRRREAFVALAHHLTGAASVLDEARWCHETPMAVTKDGREACFFAAWSRAAAFMQARGVFSGEGGVIGLAAACAGWTVDFEALDSIYRAIRHEGGGPKSA
jgi:hypothetical protein